MAQNIFNNPLTLNQNNISRGDLLQLESADISFGRSRKYTTSVITGFNSNIQGTSYTLSPNAPYNDINASFPSSASVMIIASSSLLDTLLGDGARTVKIVGLDQDWRQIEETITLNGQTGVPTSLSYLRINKLECLTAGSSGSNDGIISITDISDSFIGGVPVARLYKAIDIGAFVSSTFTYSIPEGFIFLPTKMELQSSIRNGRVLEISLYSIKRDDESNGSGASLDDRFYLSNVNQSETNLRQKNPYASRTDLYLTAARIEGNSTLRLYSKLSGILKQDY